MEGDTIKQEERKEKFRKNISEEPVSYSKQNYIAETLSKNKYQGCLLRKMFGTILEVNQRRTETNGRENKKTNDKVLHPREDVDWLYMPRKEGGKELWSIDNSVDA